MSGRSFEIVHLDRHLVVVNKAAGVLTVPTERRESNTLVDQLNKHLNARFGSRTKVSVIHRLDRDTSGLLVFARDVLTAKQLVAQFEEHKAERIYAAMVKGTVRQEEFTIKDYLQTDKGLNQRSSANGELAISHFKILKRYSNATLLRVQLETGRRNQIRVHCANIGHPVLGDQRYSPDQARHMGWPHRRLALHARRLAFKHPLNHEILTFECELPREFLGFRES